MCDLRCAVTRCCDLEVGMVHDGYLKLFQLQGGPLPGGYSLVMLDEAQASTPLTLTLTLTLIPS